MALWGGRFAEQTQRSVQDFTESISYDKRLYKHDIAGSMAHAAMLGAAGIIPKESADAICRKLAVLKRRIAEGKMEFKVELEDIHMHIETALTEALGPEGARVHTARSNVNAGLFTYPCLMAADILLYQPHYVPVGEDQKQHVELCRNIAIRFNNIYGDVFRVPEPLINKVGARIYGLNTPGAKMSKSEPNGCVFLMDSPDEIRRKFKRAVTDSDTENCVHYDKENKPGVANLMNIYSTITGKTFEEIEKEFAGQGYGVFKPAVGDAVVEALAPIREEATRLIADKAYLDEVYKKGAEKASYIANKTLRKVYKKVGFYQI